MATPSNSKLREFFIEQLQDMRWAEKELVRALPKLSEAATNSDLRQAFEDHLKETETHVQRLEEVFNMIGEPVSEHKCPAMAGIVNEGEEIIKETDDGTAQRDVGLIFAGQKAEHYEIATYGGLVTLARTLGYDDAAETLAGILAEEKEADKLLTEIAESHINYEASVEES